LSSPVSKPGGEGGTDAGAVGGGGSHEAKNGGDHKKSA
jgi:hypothetical protein